MEKIEEKIYKHTLLERVMHWVNVVVMILLILSGLQIHYGTLSIFGTMNNARYIHFMSMYLFFFMGIVYIYQFFVLGRYRDSMFMPRDIKGVIPTIKYYLFLTDEEPHFEKYNPLQKIAYGGTFFMGVVMALTGFAIYWPKPFVFVCSFCGGVGYVRTIHYLFSWMFIAFLMIHVYLVCTEDFKDSLIGMITGYVPKKEEKA